MKWFSDLRALAQALHYPAIEWGGRRVAGAMAWDDFLNRGTTRELRCALEELRIRERAAAAKYQPNKCQLVRRPAAPKREPTSAFSEQPSPSELRTFFRAVVASQRC